MTENQTEHPDPEDVKKAMNSFLNATINQGTPEEFQELLKKGMERMMNELGETSDIAKKPKKKHTKHSTRAAKIAQLRK